MINRVDIWKVGDYIEHIPKQYNEEVKFDITDSGAKIVLCLGGIWRKKEIDSFKNGEIRLGYFKYKNVIMILLKIGNLYWVDMPYSIHLSNNLTQIPMFEIGNGLGLNTTIYLINANNGKIEALRVVGASNKFTVNLIDDIKKQQEMSFKGYDENLDYIYKKYPRTTDLIKDAKVMDSWTI